MNHRRRIPDKSTVCIYLFSRTCYIVRSSHLLGSSDLIMFSGYFEIQCSLCDSFCIFLLRSYSTVDSLLTTYGKKCGPEQLRYFPEDILECARPKFHGFYSRVTVKWEQSISCLQNFLSNTVAYIKPPQTSRPWKPLRSGGHQIREY